MRHVSMVVFVLFAVFLTTAAVVRGVGAIEPVEGLALQSDPVPRTEESVAAGRITYARFCRSCHGPEGKGDGGGAPPDTVVSNLVDDQWDNGDTDAEIYKAINEGVPPDLFMEPWEGRISDEDIWNVINYLRDLAEM